MQQSFFRTLLLMSLALFLTHCPKGQEGLPENIDGLLDSPAGSSVLIFSADIKSDSNLQAKANQVKMRLEAFGVKGIEVDPLKPANIRVQVPSVNSLLLEKIQQLITRPSSISIAPVVSKDDFFDKVKNRLKNYKGAKVQKDELGIMRTDRKTKVRFILTADAQQMHSLLKNMKTPEGTRLVPMWSDRGAMAFLVQHPAPMTNPVITHIKPVASQDTAGMGVEAELAKPYWDEFADLVRANLNRPIAIIVNDQVVAVPVVSSKIRRGTIVIKPSPMVKPEESQKQARRLAIELKSWQLVGNFKLVAKKISAKPGS